MFSKKNCKYFLITVCLCINFAFFAEAFNYDSASQLPLFKSEIKTLATKAVILAQSRLANNPKDEKGLVLLNFAKHFMPENRDVLLLRGKLRFNVKIEPPKSKASQSEFVDLLEDGFKKVKNKNTAISRHLTAIFCATIRMFKPDDEEAIITLISFEDEGINTDLEQLLGRNLQQSQNVKYDRNDSRYVISDIKKSLVVPANEPWTDSFVKVKIGKIIRVKAFRSWRMGDVGRKLSTCDADGYTDFDPLDPNKKPANKKKKVPAAFSKTELQAYPGSLLAQIGKKIYPVGREAVFRAETEGILYFGPYEWGDYSDNEGSLLVSFEVSDK